MLPKLKLHKISKSFYGLSTFDYISISRIYDQICVKMEKYSGVDVTLEQGYLFTVYDKGCGDDLSHIRLIIIANEPRLDRDNEPLIRDNKIESWNEWNVPPYRKYLMEWSKIARIDPSQILWLNTLPISAPLGGHANASDAEKLALMKNKHIFTYLQLQEILFVHRPDAIIFAGNTACNVLKAVSKEPEDEDLKHLYASEKSDFSKRYKDQATILRMQNENFDRITPIIQTWHPARCMLFTVTHSAKKKFQNSDRRDV